jgi:hypothetical protein
LDRNRSRASAGGQSDQTRGVDASTWLPDIANALRRTRWRIVATIRTFDLKHGPRWRQMFRGDSVDHAYADLDLSSTRHIVVADLTDAELAPLRAASPQLDKLIDDIGGRVGELLTNPFSLDLAAQLVASLGRLTLHPSAVGSTSFICTGNVALRVNPWTWNE